MRYLTTLNRLVMSLALCLLLAPELLLAQGRSYVPSQGVATTGGTFTGPILLPDGTTAAPALSFASDTNTGIYWRIAEHLSLVAGGAVVAAVSQGDFRMNSVLPITWSAGTPDVSSSDLKLYRDAANTLALRNAANAQAFNVYNTYTDSSNYERGTVYFTGNTFTISTSAAGTGTNRGMALAPAGATIALSGTSYPGADDTYDLATFGTPRFWRNLGLRHSIQGGKTKALTEGAATGFVRVAVPTTAAQNYGGGRVGYTVYATDATDSQSLVGDVRFAMLNKAGTEVCTIGEVGTPVLAETAGGSTLTCTFTCATAAADTVDLAANCTSSLAQTIFTIEHRGDMQKTNTWTPQ